VFVGVSSGASLRRLQGGDLVQGEHGTLEEARGWISGAVGGWVLAAKGGWGWVEGEVAAAD
jgi:hypothetical protein